MNINWGGEGYCDYQGYLKVSQDEKNAQNQAKWESNFLQNMMQTQFSEQQSLLNNFLLPQLKQMASNPQGFGAKALADMQSQLISTVGSQFASQAKGLQQRFAANNMAGLGSGFQTALQAGLAQGAGTAEAQGLMNIDLNNEALKNQQQQFALGGLQGATSLLGAAPQSAGLGLGANQNFFNQAHTIATQGGLWQNLLGGVVGAGLNFATGGLNNMLQGGSFFGGASPQQQAQQFGEGTSG